MNRDRSSSLWIAMADVLFAILAVVIVQVSQTKAKVDGVPDKSWFLLTVDWDKAEDADVDSWLFGPSKKPVFYGSRDVGCARLDTDSRGFMDGRIRLADGTTTEVTSYKETIQIRCIEPGHWEWGANLFQYHENGATVGKPKGGIKVHAELIGMNPAYHIVYSGDVVLGTIGETQNITAFDLDKEGNITLAPPALEPVTTTYMKSHSFGATPTAIPGAPQP